MNRLARRLPNAKGPIVLEGARIPEERAERFNQVLRDFWS
jgi:hypothetical protein